MKILSLGAGVQSSTIALKMAKSEMEPCDHAIFADTGAEPQVVYDYLDYLIPLLPFPVHVVSAGNLADDFLTALSSENGRCGQPPFQVKDRTTGEIGKIWRKCTTDYKLTPIRRKVRELRGKDHVFQLIGISLDEAHRMKPSGVKYITNTYPLIDARMSRHDCLLWIKKNGYKLPPKSACWFCPYMSNKRLRWMRDHNPDEWKKLVDYDHTMRRIQKQVPGGAGINGELYVHRDCKPIDEIDLSNDLDMGQMDMFGEECEGMCGL